MMSFNTCSYVSLKRLARINSKIMLNYNIFLLFDNKTDYM